MSYVGRTAVLTHSMFSIETQQKLHRAEFGMQRNTQTLFIRNESEICQIPYPYHVDQYLLFEGLLKRFFVKCSYNQHKQMCSGSGHIIIF